MAEHLLTRPVGTLSLADMAVAAALFIALSTAIDMLMLWWKGRK